MEPDIAPEAPAPVRRSTVTAVELDGETVLYDEATEQLHTLDPIATAVWQRLEVRGSMGQLIAGLQDRFQADPAAIRSDVMTLVRQLQDLGLVDDGPRDFAATDRADRPGSDAEGSSRRVLPEPGSG